MLVIDEQVKMGEEILAEDAAYFCIRRVQLTQIVNRSQHISHPEAPELYLAKLSKCLVVVGCYAGHLCRAFGRQGEL